MKNSHSGQSAPQNDIGGVLNARSVLGHTYTMDLQRFAEGDPPPADPPANDPPANPAPGTKEPPAQDPPPADPAKAPDPNPTDPAKGPAKDPAKEPDPNANQPPENYDLKLPEGYAIAETDNESLISFLKENKIPQEQAQRLADMYVKSQQDSQARQIVGWQKETEAYLKTGRDEKLQLAAKGLAVFDPDGNFSKILDATGLGENVEFLKRFEALGRRISEGKFVEGEPAKGGNFLSNMYTSMKD